MPNQQIIEWSGDCSVPLDEAAVIASKSEEFTDVHSALRNRPMLHRFYIGRIRIKKSLSGHNMPKIGHLASEQLAL